MPDKNKYYLFIDECGDQNLENYNPDFPIFTLCGILVSQNERNRLIGLIDSLKDEFWGNKNIILHSRDIRRCKKEFINLLDPKIKNNFYHRLNSILGSSSYTIIACTIRKEPFINIFSRYEDVYGLSLSYLIERSILCLEEREENPKLEIIFEKRGKVEDKSLIHFYNGLRVTGTEWVHANKLVEVIEGFHGMSKKENNVGLQITDLVAYPISRKVLDPDIANPSFEVIKPKIYSSHGAMIGLKVIP